MKLENWVDIAKRVGSLGEDGGESGSGEMALRALELVLGEESLREAVHYYVEGKPGSELMRSVLWQLHPWSAMEECVKIFKEGKEIENRRRAVELLRVVADKRALPWVPDFLSDEDEEIQIWGIGVVDQLFFSGLCEEEDLKEILAGAAAHSNPGVRKKAEEIKAMLNEGRERTLILEKWYEERERR